MTKDEILPTLNDIASNVFDRDDIKLTLDTTAEDIPEWDSFNHVNLIVAVEVRFGVKIKAAETEELKNVGELVSLITHKLNL